MSRIMHGSHGEIRTLKLLSLNETPVPIRLRGIKFYSILLNGGPTGSRTPNLFGASEALSQLELPAHIVREHNLSLQSTYSGVPQAFHRTNLTTS